MPAIIQTRKSGGRRKAWQHGSPGLRKSSMEMGERKRGELYDLEEPQSLKAWQNHAKPLAGGLQ